MVAKSIAELIRHCEMQRQQLRMHLQVHELLEQSTSDHLAGNREAAWAALLDAWRLNHRSAAQRRATAGWRAQESVEPSSTARGAPIDR